MFIGQKIIVKNVVRDFTKGEYEYKKTGQRMNDIGGLMVEWIRTSKRTKKSVELMIYDYYCKRDIMYMFECN